MVYTERELDIPALRYLKDNPDGLNTSIIITLLEQELQPSGHDAELIKGRRDTHFSQKVRNLICHRGSRTSLISRGLTTYSGGRNGISKITKRGIQFLDENKITVDFLKTFGDDMSKKAISKYPEIILDDFISEGFQSIIPQKHRQRSSKLRGIALKYFKENLNGLRCEACGFDFFNVYGELGKNFIEIHHKEPIKEMDIMGSGSKIKEALKKVSPLCSNCHRMVHREKDKILSIEGLKKAIRKV